MTWASISASTGASAAAAAPTWSASVERLMSTPSSLSVAIIASAPDAAALTRAAVSTTASAHASEAGSAARNASTSGKAVVMVGD